MEIEGERVSSGQNERKLLGRGGRGRVQENEQGRTRREGACQNSGIMSERTF